MAPQKISSLTMEVNVLKLNFIEMCEALRITLKTTAAESP